MVSSLIMIFQGNIILNFKKEFIFIASTDLQKITSITPLPLNNLHILKFASLKLLLLRMCKKQTEKP